MQIQVEIGFEKLMEIIRQLPATKLSLIKEVLEKETAEDTKIQDIEGFLLKAPTFTKNQIAAISKTRKEINQWRQH